MVSEETRISEILALGFSFLCKFSSRLRSYSSLSKWIFPGCLKRLSAPAPLLPLPPRPSTLMPLMKNFCSISLHYNLEAISQSYAQSTQVSSQYSKRKIISKKRKKTQQCSFHELSQKHVIPSWRSSDPYLSLESDWDLSPKYSCPDYLTLLGLAVATKFQLSMWVACFLHTLKDGQGKPAGQVGDSKSPKCLK